LRPGLCLGLCLPLCLRVGRQALVLSWNVDDVVAKNCKIKILGIDIASYCGILEKAIKNGVNVLSQRVTKVAAPEIAHKLEAAINTKIGSVVRIPIKL